MKCGAGNILAGLALHRGPPFAMTAAFLYPIGTQLIFVL
jgi:hypothetical protein